MMPMTAMSFWKKLFGRRIVYGIPDVLIAFSIGILLSEMRDDIGPFGHVDGHVHDLPDACSPRRGYGVQPLLGLFPADRRDQE